MKTPPLVGALSAVLLTGALHATELPTPTDFAWGIPVTLDADRPLQRLDLPAAVYAGAVRPDLGDLRVFNGAGEPVPHTLLVPPDPAALIQWSSAPLFALPDSAPDGDLAVQVRTDARGAIVQVNQRGATERRTGRGAAADPGSSRAWLVDLSQHPDPISRLRLQWSKPAAPFAGAITVATSDSLDRWRQLAEVTVAELVHGETRLRRDEIAVDGSARYLRLTWIDPNPPVALVGVEVARSAPVEAEWRWQTLTPTATTDESMIYASGGHWPVARLQLALPAPNQLAAVDIAVAPATDTPWQPIGHYRFHRLQLAGEELRNDPIVLAPRTAQRWRLRGNPSELRGVRLELGWRPHQLLFLGQGDGPYTLAYGSGRVQRAEGALPALLQAHPDSETLIAVATAGAPAELGGRAALAVPRPPLPWHQIGLWAVLVSCVLLLAAVAWRLFGEMNPKPQPEE